MASVRMLAEAAGGAAGKKGGAGKTLSDLQAEVFNNMVRAWAAFCV
jgi:hypothetical protein